MFLGSGMYHSTELFCDYVPGKLYPPKGWKSYLALELGGRIVELSQTLHGYVNLRSAMHNPSTPLHIVPC